MYRKFKKCFFLGLLVHVTPSIFFRRILRSEALVYKSYFFRKAVLRKLFDIRFSYNRCNFSRVCLLVTQDGIWCPIYLYEFNVRWRRKPWQSTDATILEVPHPGSWSPGHERRVGLHKWNTTLMLFKYDCKLIDRHRKRQNLELKIVACIACGIAFAPVNF